jgi:6-phosphogluconolactonase
MGESVIPRVHSFKTLGEASLALAERIVEAARVAIEDHGRYTMALSGGKTPVLLYSLLASEFAGRLGWKSVHLFWGDERFVPQDHPDNNFRMAYDAWISKIPIPHQNIHRIPTETATPEKAARSYEQTLKEFFDSPGKKSFPVFDAMLLGVGADGHTASLFPGSRILGEKSRWVVSAEAPPSVFPNERITLTLPLINSSREVLFLAFGEEKKNVLKEIFEVPEKAKKVYPAAMVKPRERLQWYLEKEV